MLFSILLTSRRVIPAPWLQPGGKTSCRSWLQGKGWRTGCLAILGPSPCSALRRSLDGAACISSRVYRGILPGSSSGETQNQAPGGSQCPHCCLSWLPDTAPSPALGAGAAPALLCCFSRLLTSLMKWSWAAAGVQVLQPPPDRCPPRSCCSRRPTRVCGTSTRSSAPQTARTTSSSPSSSGALAPGPRAPPRAAPVSPAPQPRDALEIPASVVSGDLG